jgi:hypothetical protein
MCPQNRMQKESIKTKAAQNMMFILRIQWIRSLAIVGTQNSLFAYFCEVKFENQPETPARLICAKKVLKKQRRRKKRTGQRDSACGSLLAGFRKLITNKISQVHAT